MYHICICIHSSANGHLCCFHILAIVNSAAMSIVIYVSLSILVSSGYMLEVVSLGHMGGFIPRFLRNLHTVLDCGCINIQSHQKCERVLFFSTSSGTYCLQVFRYIYFLLNLLMTESICTAKPCLRIQRNSTMDSLIHPSYSTLKLDS